MANYNYQITWDDWATPTISGNNWQDVYAGLGFAHTFNHPNLLLISVLRGQGRAAEFIGQHSGPGPNAFTKQPEGVDFLQSDRLVWQLGVAALGEDYWQQQEEEMASKIEAYCHGINACREAHPERFHEYLHGVPIITPSMLMGHVAHVLVGFQIMLRQPTLMQWAMGSDAVVPSWQDFANAGSNACVIGPSKSVNGNPMLVCNPHTQWNVDLNTLMEVRMEVSGDITMQGAGIVGWPSLMMGCNGHGGFAATVNTQNGLSFYQLDVDDSSYLLDGQPQQLTIKQRSIPCLESDGSHSYHQQAQVWSDRHQAFSIAQRGQQQLLVNMAGRGHGNVPQQMFAMSAARSVSDFKQALQHHQLPMFNILYAGRDADSQTGHIHYSFHSLPPNRDKGTWADWWQVLDGHQASNIASGTLPFEKLFMHQDSASGWYQNCNDSPYTCTLPSPFYPQDYEPWLAPEYTNFRAQSYNRLMSATDKFDFDSFYAVKFDTRVELASHVLPALLDAIDQLEDPSATLQRAASVLKHWDCYTNPDSRGAYLFLHWLLKMETQDAAATPLFKDAWQCSLATDKEQSLASLDVPNQLADISACIVALEAAAELLMQEVGCLDVPWGEVVKISHGDVTIDAIGGPGDPMGIIAAVPIAQHLRPFIKGGKLVSNRIENDGGETFIMVVEFTPEGAQGRTMISYGNSSDYQSQHFGDQLNLLPNRQLKPFTISINQ